MKDTLVTFETAKLAKEKGFSVEDAEGMMFYVDSKNAGLLRDTGQLPDSYSECYYESDKDILSPTQSLFQKWLREDHKIIVEITWQMCSTGYEYAVINMNNPPEYNDDIERITSFKTYEIALEEGLKEALKLI